MLYHRFGTFRTEHITITNHYGTPAFLILRIISQFALPVYICSLVRQMNHYNTYTSIFTSLSNLNHIYTFSSQPILILIVIGLCTALTTAVSISWILSTSLRSARFCLKLFGKLWHWTTHIYIKKTTFRILSNIFCRTNETL